MERDGNRIGAGTWALAGLWAVLLAGAPVFLARVRREVEDMGCFAVGREATTPFSQQRHLSTTAMELPWPTGVAFAVPLAVWLALAVAVPWLLLWKTKRLTRRAATIVDVLAAVGFVVTLGVLIAARVIPQ
ncbi:MAG: hypothetical protein ACYTKD_05260 [Planctomycetota bacterium]